MAKRSSGGALRGRRCRGGVEELIRKADALMYTTKMGGKDGASFAK